MEGQLPVDVALGPHVKGDNREALALKGGRLQLGSRNGKRGRAVRPLIDFPGGDLFHVVHSHQAIPFARPPDGFLIGNILRAEAGLEGAMHADPLGQRAGVDAAQAGNVVFL